MRTLVTSLALCLVIAWPAVAPAQTLDSETEAVTRKLFDAQAIGVELKLQGEYVGKDGEKSVSAQVVMRGEKSFHALVLEGGLPGDGWDGGRYGLLESAPLSRAPRGAIRRVAHLGQQNPLGHGATHLDEGICC